MPYQLKSIVVPATKQESYCIIILHGLGSSGDDLQFLSQQLQFAVKLQTKFIFPHASLMPVAINDNIIMPAWYDILGLGIDSAQDVVGVKKAAKLIHNLIDEQIANGIAANNIILGGFSQGGALALYSGTTYHQKLAGIISLSAYFPIANQITSASIEKNLNTPIFIGHGVNDSVVDIRFAHLALEHFQSFDYTQVSFHEYCCMHTIDAKEIIDICAWLNKILYCAV